MQSLKPSRPCRRKLVRLALAAGAGSLSIWQRPVLATSYVWNNTTGGSWSAPAPTGNWNDGSVVPVSDFNNQFLFNTSAFSYTTTADIVGNDGPLNLNNLTFSLGSSDTVTLSQVAQSVDVLNFGPDASNDTPQLLLSSGSATIANQINGSAGMIINNTGVGNLTLSNQFFGANETVTNAANGKIILTDGSAFTSSTLLTNTVTFANLGGMNGGTGTFTIGNLTSGVDGTINIIGPVTFSGNTGGDLFSSNAILNVEAGSSFNFANNPETMGGIEGPGNIIEGSAGITCVEAGDRNFNGSISGSSGLAQDVANILTLGGSNTYTGTTTIEAGGTIRALAADAFSPASLVNVTAGTFDVGGFNQSIAGLAGVNQTGSLPLGGSTLTINISNGASDTFFSPLTGTGASLVLMGNGTETLPGASSYSGTTNIAGGTLHIAWAVLAQGSGVTIGSGATLQTFIASNSTAVPLSGAGTLTIDGGSVNLTLSTGNPNLTLSALNLNGGGVTLDHSTDNTSEIGSVASLNLGSGTVTLVGNPSAVSGQIFIATALTGGATLSVISKGQNANINTGAMTRAGLGSTINFALTNSGSGIAAVTTTTANSNYGIVGGYATVNGMSWAVTGTGTGPFNVTSLPATSYTSLFNQANATTVLHTDVTGAIAATSAYTSDVRFNTSGAETITISGISTIVDGGILVTPNVGAHTSTITGGTLAAPAGQDLVVNQCNTVGNFNVASVVSNTPGTPVTVSGVSTSGSSSTTQTLTVSSTAGILLGDQVTAVNSSNGATISAASNATVVAINSATSVTIALSAATQTSTGSTVSFTPETNVVKSGPGTLNLTKTNTFAGVLALNAGTVMASTAANYGSASNGSSTVYFNGGALEATASISQGLGVNNFIFGPGGGTLQISSGTTLSKYGNTVWGSGPLTIIGGGLFAVGTDNSAFSGSITVNNGILRQTSNQLIAANGVMINNGGQYQIEDNGTGSWNFLANTALTLNGIGPASYTYPGALTLTVQSGGGPISTFTNAVILASNSTIGAYSTSAYNASLILSGVVSGPGTLTTTANGTYGGSVTFSGANTYTGGTNISAGTFLVTNTTGSGTGAGVVNVFSGATLGGKGTISGAVNVAAGGTIFAGTTNDTINKSGATLTVGSGSSLMGTTELDLTAGPTGISTVGASDMIVFGSTAAPGTAAFGGILAVTNPNSITLPIGDSFNLFTFGSNPGATTFAGFSMPVLAPGLSWNTSNIGTTGAVSIYHAQASLTFNNTGGSGDGITFDTTNLNWNNGGVVMPFFTGDSVTFDDTTPNNQYNVSINSQVMPASVTFNNSAGNYAVSGAGGINGSAGVVKSGSGMVTLSNANTYTGGTNISAGSLLVTNTIGSATGTGAVLVSGKLGGGGIITGPVTVAAGGVLAPGFANTSTATTMTIGSGSVLGGTTILDLTATNISDEVIVGSVAAPGTVNLSGGSLDVVNTGNLTFSAGESFTLLDVSSALGSFASTPTLPSLGAGLAWNISTSGSGPLVISIYASSNNAANLTWSNSAATGTWDTVSSNWNNGSGSVTYNNNSNGNSGDNVAFSDSNGGAGNYAVSISGIVSPSSTTFNNSAGNYVITGSNGSSGIAGSGSVTKYGSGTLTLSTDNTYTGGTYVLGGTLVLGRNALPAGTTLSIGANATVQVMNHSVGGAASVIRVSTLSIADPVNVWTGTLDLTNNAMIVQAGAGTSLAAITSQVAEGYNSGAWNGSGGIVSSSAANDSTHLTALGVIQNNQSGSALFTASHPFDGITPGMGDVLVKYTYYGDTNLDGKVDGTDYSRIDNGALNGLTGWFNGDFNYDGVINGSDYTLIDNAYNTQGASLSFQIAGASAVATAQIAGGSDTAAVPEPATFGLLAVGALGLLGRRRRSE